MRGLHGGIGVTQRNWGSQRDLRLHRDFGLHRGVGDT